LIPIESHKFSDFFLLGLVPAVAAIFIGWALWSNDHCDKRTRRIACCALYLGILGLAVVSWAAGGRGGGAGGV